jgi:hypothetical protein
MMALLTTIGRAEQPERSRRVEADAEPWYASIGHGFEI